MKIEPAKAYAAMVIESGEVLTGKASMDYIESCETSIKKENLVEVHIAPTETHDVVKKGEWLAEMPTEAGWYLARRQHGGHYFEKCVEVANIQPKGKGNCFYSFDIGGVTTWIFQEDMDLWNFEIYSQPIDMHQPEKEEGGSDD